MGRFNKNEIWERTCSYKSFCRDIANREIRYEQYNNINSKYGWIIAKVYFYKEGLQGHSVIVIAVNFITYNELQRGILKEEEGDCVR